MKRSACALSAALVLLTGCARNEPAIPDENGVYPAEMLFDYFFSDDMPWDETKEFKVPEYPDVKFQWSDLDVTATDDGEENSLYWGMPVWNVYLADLNGDGKGEICSAVSMGSGLVDEHIYAYDLANGKLYELSDRFSYNYKLELHDGVLVYVKTPETAEGEETSEPLTIDKMTETDESQI